MTKPVRVRSAPGLVWRQRGKGIFEARWQARTDIIAKGFKTKSVKIWSGAGNPDEITWDVIADRCRELQQEMLVWARGGLPEVGPFDGTLRSLMRAYKTDPDSQYRKIRYNSRVHYDALMSLIETEHGDKLLVDLKGRTFSRLHEDWSAGGKIAIAHAKMGMLRTLFSFGATLLEDNDCGRLSGILSKMRFAMPKPRTERLTAAQAVAIRAKAHELSRPSIALAQAIQFECMLRQKDVIGEWVPIREPGISDVQAEGLKWLRGIRWEEIDQNMTLRHLTSKRQKMIEINLRNAPMVRDELNVIAPECIYDVEIERGGKKVVETRWDRSLLPVSGPIIVSEWDRLPWTGPEFRRWWRIIAEAAGVPKEVRNMDSRAGAISEATDAGADLEHVRHAATHSNISMTQRYSRGAEDKIEVVQLARLKHRNKPET
jgi:hypothetical protein